MGIFLTTDQKVTGSTPVRYAISPCGLVVSSMSCEPIRLKEQTGLDSDALWVPEAKQDSVLIQIDVSSCKGGGVSVGRP